MQVVGRPACKRGRMFNQHAERWQYGMKGKEPGEPIQVDHTRVYCNSKQVKDCNHKADGNRNVCRSCSHTAKEFLAKMQEALLFPIKSIQLETLQPALHQYQILYNKYRPHQILAQLTSKEYFELHCQEKAA